jgi:putative acetyltransferase
MRAALWKNNLERISMSKQIEIVPVEGTEALALLRGLLEEYWESFGFTPCFQNFAGELAGLPGAYVPPHGRLAMAWMGGEPAGCIALRRFDGSRAEVKRLYVRPKFRGCGAGRALLEWVIAEARSAAYAEIVGDTMPVMQDALALYERRGFERTSPYAAQPTEGAIFIRLALAPPQERRGRQV